MNLTRRRPRWLPDPDLGESTFMGEVLRRETVGGTIALVAAAIAVIWANIDQTSYHDLVSLEIGPLDIEHWAADGALTLFFFVAGLELKREFVVGSLRKPADAAVPVVAAVCGVLVPAGIFLAFNAGGPGAGGWAIPSATDIAFALAVLAVVGSSLPNQLRSFLLTLAVVDDLIVIVIIAIFYTSSIDLDSLAATGGLLVLYLVMQRGRVRTAFVYVPIAVAAWWFMHESGIHATIAGVLMGLLTRVRPDKDETRSPAERLEHRLVPLSAGVAVPFFAFASAGVVFAVDGLVSPIAIGVILGLVIGKPLGVLGGSWLLTRFTRAELNPNITWRDVVGVAVLAGVGFTVSLLVSDLSFSDERRVEAKSAVLLGSFIAAVLAGVILRKRNRFHAEP